MSRKKISAIVVTVMLLGGIIGEGMAISAEDLLQLPSLGELPPFYPGGRFEQWSLSLQIAAGALRRTTFGREPVTPEVTKEFLAGIEDFFSRAQLLSPAGMPWGVPLELGKDSDFMAVFVARLNFPAQIFSRDDSKELKQFSKLWQLIETTVRNHYLATGEHLGIDELHGIVQGLLPEGIRAEIENGMLKIYDAKYAMLVDKTSESYTFQLDNRVNGDFAQKTVEYMPLTPHAFIINEVYGYCKGEEWVVFGTLRKVYPGTEGYIYEEQYELQGSLIGKFLIKDLEIDGGRITAQIEYHVYDDK